MAKVKAIKTGYYDHRIIPEGAIFDMKEVDHDGYYVDEKGKKILFKTLDKDGKEIGEPKARKCKWVDNAKSKLANPKDPFEIAKVISGKQALSSTTIEVPGN